MLSQESDRQSDLAVESEISEQPDAFFQVQPKWIFSHEVVSTSESKVGKYTDTLLISDWSFVVPLDDLDDPRHLPG